MMSEPFTITLSPESAREVSAAIEQALGRCPHHPNTCQPCRYLNRVIDQIDDASAPKEVVSWPRPESTDVKTPIADELAKKPSDFYGEPL